MNDISACGARDTAKMVALYQQYLEGLLSGFNVSWWATYKRPFGRALWFIPIMDDWKIVATIFPVGSDKKHAEENRLYFREAHERGGIDPHLMFVIKNAGDTRVARIEDAISLDEWRQHWKYERMQDEGSEERMVATFALSDTAESHFSIDRAVGQAAFTEDDADRFYHAIKLVPRLHYLLFLERGLVAPALAPLSPRHQEVLHLLLEPLSEQAISEKLHLAKSTLHSYVVLLYKNFQVSSRYELTQLWL
jgi:ATP/maltotriose-dependent transcriptional regulator MalT